MWSTLTPKWVFFGSSTWRSSKPHTTLPSQSCMHRSGVAPLIHGPACFSHSLTLHVLARVWSHCCKGCYFAFLSSPRWVCLACNLQLTCVSASVVFAGVVRTRVSRARFVLTHVAWLSAVSGVVYISIDREPTHIHAHQLLSFPSTVSLVRFQTPCSGLQRYVVILPR